MISHYAKTRQANEIDGLVGATLRVLRESKGVSQEALSHVLKVSAQQIQKYEAGSNRISAGKLYTCAEFLGVSVCHFFKNCPKHPPHPTLPHDFVEKYSSLPKEKQKLIQDMVRVFHEEE